MKSSSFVRWSGVCLILAGLLHLVIGPLQQFAPVEPPSLDFSVRNGLIALTHALVLVGIIGLARSGAAGDGWLGKIGLGLAFVMGTLFIPAELTIQVNYALGATLDGICAMGLGLGMILVGISVLQAGRWQGWRRYIPLLFGLYPFLLIMPFVFLTGAPNFVAIGGWGLFSLLLGVALRAEDAVVARQQTAQAAIR
jgi:hypothetical protein